MRHPAGHPSARPARLFYRSSTPASSSSPGSLDGKGIDPTPSTDHPAVFATLTAPSTEPSTPPADLRPPACRGAVDRSLPPWQTATLPASSTNPATAKYRPAPLRHDCYDYPGAVMFNARVNELWRRTTINIRRALAATARPHRPRTSTTNKRLAFIKVVEYQARGLVHFHALARLDPNPDNDLPVDTAHLAAALRAGAARAAAPNPYRPAQPIRWGANSTSALSTTPAAEPRPTTWPNTPRRSSDPGGALDHRLRNDDLDQPSHLPDHLRHHGRNGLGPRPANPLSTDLNLRLWAHTLGYRGHWLTKSRSLVHHLHPATHRPPHLAAPTTRPPPDDPNRHGEWEYHGTGHTTPGDTWLAQIAHQNQTLNRRTAWEER